jgi:DNA mismatch repair protein MutS
MIALEQDIYEGLVNSLAQYLRTMQHTASHIARIDCLLSFARIAVERNYCRPVINDSKVLDIKDGRHPVIETLLPVGETYIPNDIFLDDKNQQIMMITGPNMAGKSALLRQTALIVLMAQTGSFVPALSAKIGIVDKIFTRVGASDNLSQGESTFMVEMLESASILNNISERSLLLLDEIGRGTSTYDGISIAWSMVEYIHNHPTHAKTLFATHYHELNELEQSCERVKNYNVSVKEVDRTIVFLRRLVPGGTEHSFGIHVARMAGMPRPVVDRAEQMLHSMETTHRETAPDTPSGKRTKTAAGKIAPQPSSQGGVQLSIFQLDDPVLKQIRDEIKGLDVNSLTPLEALNKLNEIKKITGL